MVVNFEERTERRLNDHSDRLRALETSDARQTVLIEEMVKKMDSLISWIKALLIAWATGMGGALLFGIFRVYPDKKVV